MSNRKHQQRRHPETRPAIKQNGGYTSRRKDVLTAQGKITECYGYEQYRILLDNGIEIRATLSGKMRQNHIRVLTGDRVEIELSPYDLTHGRINRRFKVQQ